MADPRLFISRRRRDVGRLRRVSCLTYTVYTYDTNMAETTENYLPNDANQRTPAMPTAILYRLQLAQITVSS